MSLDWREKWLRITRLSWDEIHTRVGQGLGKRLDRTFLRSGFRRGSIDLVETNRRGNFFFSPQQLPDRIRLLRQHLPVEVDGIIGEANEICQHRFRVLGYTDIDYGREIDWHLDAVHGKRSPLKPWHKINFFDFDQIGDHKVTWELNRHQHLVTLAKAWLFTRHPGYIRELISQWYSWQRANPYAMGINWASTLEVAFRSLSWIWVRELLSDCSEVNDKFHADILRALAVSGRYIERYLSTYFSPNTHLLGEAAVLFFIGVLCPQIASADRWRNKGLEILLQEAERQVHEDGVYFEQSSYYHVYALDLFLHARLLASGNHLDVPKNFDDVLQKMLVFIEVLSQSGPPPSFGDDDGGRLFNPRRNRSEHMTDPLAIGAILFQKPEFRCAAKLTEEVVWLFGEQATSYLSGGSQSLPTPAKSFPHGGIYISTSVNPLQQIMIDAGPLGAMRAGHGHADALSVKYSAHGQPYLIDSGTFCYMSPGDERNSFRGTGAHNTLRVDELDQAIPNGPFAWKGQPAVSAESWITGETFTYFVGSHTGYLRLDDPVIHRRFVFHLYDGFWMVRDVVEGETQHLIETFWHLHPRLAVRPVDGGFVAQDEKDHKDVTFAPVSDSEWICEVIPGQVSPAYGIADPAPVLRCGGAVSLPAEHAMVIRALREQNEAAGQLVRVTMPLADLNGVKVYEYAETSREHFLLFRTPGVNAWRYADWHSDAEFLYYCSEGQRISRLVACQASFIEYKGEALVSGSHRIEHFEYVDHGGKRKAFSSDKEALGTFTDTALASFSAGVVR